MLSNLMFGVLLTADQDSDHGRCTCMQRYKGLRLKSIALKWLEPTVSHVVCR